MKPFDCYETNGMSRCHHIQCGLGRLIERLDPPSTEITIQNIATGETWYRKQIQGGFELFYIDDNGLCSTRGGNEMFNPPIKITVAHKS